MNPINYGPTGIPPLTIGWRALDWTADYLLQPDGPNAGAPWVFTDEQARFLLWFYAIDRTGRFQYRYAMLRRLKGWGKDPFAAALACIEFVGPCRFAGWKGEEPYTKSHGAAWVQIAAVSKEQTRNTMTLFPGMLSKRAQEEYSIDLGKEIMYAHKGRCRLEAVTSSPRTLEGGRATFVVKNETHHWIQANEGLAMADVIARNIAKSRDGASRALAITNAHAPGEGSDAERDWEAYQEDPTGVLYDSVEAPEIDMEDEDALRQAIALCRGDSKWLDIDRLVAEIRDPKTGKNTSKRYYLNQLAASEDRAFDVDAWRRQALPGYVIPDGEMVTLGFDGSRTRDSTAIVATEVQTGTQQLVAVWERPPFAQEWQVPEIQVDFAIAECFRRWNVLRCYCDPYYWESFVSKWAGDFGDKKVLEFHTNALKRMTNALKAYDEAMRTGEVTHDGSEQFARHIGNAFKSSASFRDDRGEFMWTITKERQDSPKKIDIAMAGCLSWEARKDAIAAGEAVIDTVETKVWFA